MGSGKTHYSKVWEKNGYTPISLATPLKDYVHKKLDEQGISYNHNDKDNVINKSEMFGHDMTLRDHYIANAQMLKIALGDDCFIKYFLKEVENNPDKQFICDDVRTPEEYQALKDNGFVFIFVDRLLDTPDNEMEGLLFSDVHHHLCNTDDYCIPNFYTSSPNYDQFVFKHIVESKEVDFELLKKILLEGIKKIQSDSNPTTDYKIDSKFKNTKLIDRQVVIGEATFNLHNLKDVSIVASFLKWSINKHSGVELVVDNNLDSVVELIQMDNNEEEE
jgi:uncharacterized ubiquitin-like protein YukD